VLGPSTNKKKKNKKQEGAAAPQKTKNTKNANKFVARCSQGHPLKFDANAQVGTQYFRLAKITSKVLFFCFEGKISQNSCVYRRRPGCVMAGTSQAAATGIHHREGGATCTVFKG
jgi:hypothetical protein